MKNIKCLLLVGFLIMGQAIFASESASKRLTTENEMLKAYLYCTERVMRQERLFGIDVRSGLYDCRNQYFSAQDEYNSECYSDMLKYIFAENSKEISARKEKTAVDKK